MSQYYPQQGPSYPPEQGPEYYDEGDYEYEDIEEGAATQNPLFQTALAFVAGGCLVFLCISLCAVVLGALWVLDPGSSAAEPAEGSDVGLTFDNAAFSYESVVNDQNMQLTILDVNRNAQLQTIPPQAGREVIIVTIELVNLGIEDAPFNEREFLLLNSREEAYTANVGAIDGALGRGSLPPNEGLEGRLVFEVAEGEFDLRVLWEARESDPRYIFLE